MDQADGLRLRMENQKNSNLSQSRHHVIAVASGKGGVGKTNFCVNFALELQRAGRNPVVLDVDVGFGNVELLLGHRPKHTISDLLQGTDIWEVIQTSSQGLPYMSAGSGLLDLHELAVPQVEKVLTELEHLSDKYDTLLLDCGSGHGANAGRIVAAADELIMVTTPEPTAIADAYAMLKLLHIHGQVPSTRIVVNRASRIVEAKLAADKLTMVAERFLGLKLGVLGYILEDTAVSNSVMEQQAVLVKYPHSTATGCIRQLVRNYLHLEPLPAKSGLSGFFERLLRSRLHRNPNKSIS